MSGLVSKTPHQHRMVGPPGDTALVLDSLSTYRNSNPYGVIVMTRMLGDGIGRKGLVQTTDTVTQAFSNDIGER